MDNILTKQYVVDGNLVQMYVEKELMVDVKPDLSNVTFKVAFSAVGITNVEKANKMYNSLVDFIT